MNATSISQWNIAVVFAHWPSTKDYGIYFVSHFAYLLKGMERNGMIIQH